MARTVYKPKRAPYTCILIILQSLDYNCNFKSYPMWLKQAFWLVQEIRNVVPIDRNNFNFIIFGNFIKRFELKTYEGKYSLTPNITICIYFFF